MYTCKFVDSGMPGYQMLKGVPIMNLTWWIGCLLYVRNGDILTYTTDAQPQYEEISNIPVDTQR